MKNSLAISALVLLAACSTTPGTPPAPSNGVAALEIALTAADQAALAYVTLPACPSSTKALCSDAATVSQIKTASATAYSAVKAVQAGTADTVAAQAAIAALAALTPATK